MFVDLHATDPGTLDVLARYFETEAARLRSAADQARRQAASAVAARERRQRSKAAFARIGARVAVLARRASLQAAICEVAAREGMSLEMVRTAESLWRRRKAARDALRRDQAIFVALLQGVPAAELAARHGLTPRRIRMIGAERAKAISAVR